MQISPILQMELQVNGLENFSSLAYLCRSVHEIIDELFQQIIQNKRDCIHFGTCSVPLSDKRILFVLPYSFDVAYLAGRPVFNPQQ